MQSVTIEIIDINQTITIQGNEFVLVPKKAAETVFEQNKVYKLEVEKLKNMTMSILKLLNLNNEKTGTIKQSIQSGEEGYFKHILKGLNKVVGLLVQAQFSKSAQKELEETFAFIKNIIPIANKYANTSKSKPVENITNER